MCVQEYYSSMMMCLVFKFQYIYGNTLFSSRLESADVRTLFLRFSFVRLVPTSLNVERRQILFCDIFHIFDYNLFFEMSV